MTDDTIRRLRNRAELLTISEGYYRPAYMASWTLLRKLYRLLSEDGRYPELVAMIDDYEKRDDGMFNAWRVAIATARRSQRKHLKRLRKRARKTASPGRAPLSPIEELVEELSVIARLHFEGQGKPSPIRDGDIEVDIDDIGEG